MCVLCVAKNYILAHKVVFPFVQGIVTLYVCKSLFFLLSLRQ